MNGWEKSEFTTKTADGPISRKGYVKSVFGIERLRGEWVIYHLPTGMTFLYSYEWPSLRDAVRFADRLLEAGDWSDKKISLQPAKFNAACHALAKECGMNERRMVPIL